MNPQALLELEKSIQAHRDSIESGAALDRLNLSRDFKKLVLEGFLSKEAVRLVHLKAAPSMQTPEMQKMVSNQIDAIGCFHQYLQRVQDDAELARRLLETDEQTREEILSEDR